MTNAVDPGGNGPSSNGLLTATCLADTSYIKKSSAAHCMKVSVAYYTMSWRRRSSLCRQDGECREETDSDQRRERRHCSGMREKLSPRMCPFIPDKRYFDM
jgi:NADH pyrophosphatase NudC (nudix superfamily)